MKEIISVTLLSLLLLSCNQQKPKVCETAQSEDSHQLWKYGTDHNISSGLSASHNAVFFYQDENHQVVSLQVNTGKVNWRYSHSKNWHYLKGNMAGMVFFETLTELASYQRPGKSDLVGLDEKTGEVAFLVEIPKAGENIAQVGTAFWLRGGVLVRDGKANFGTADGSMYQYDLKTRKKLVHAKYDSAPQDGPYEFGGDLFWILENGSIIRLARETQMFERILSFDKGTRFLNAALAKEGQLLCGYANGDARLISLGRAETIWKANGRERHCRIEGVFGDFALVNRLSSLEKIDMRDGWVICEAPFECTALQVISLSGERFLLNDGSCIAKLDKNLQLIGRPILSSRLNFAVVGDTLVYYADYEVRAMRIGYIGM